MLLVSRSPELNKGTSQQAQTETGERQPQSELGHDTCSAVQTHLAASSPQQRYTPLTDAHRSDHRSKQSVRWSLPRCCKLFAEVQCLQLLLQGEGGKGGAVRMQPYYTVQLSHAQLLMSAAPCITASCLAHSKQRNFRNSLLGATCVVRGWHSRAASWRSKARNRNRSGCP